jgi:hypothetical protein
VVPAAAPTAAENQREPAEASYETSDSVRLYIRIQHTIPVSGCNVSH